MRVEKKKNRVDGVHLYFGLKKRDKKSKSLED